MKPNQKINPKSPIQLGDGEEQEQDKLGLGLSPVSSRYSSCEDSEFDRYCSATSALGTPSSVSSSIGYYNHDLGSDFEGFKLGGSRVVSRFFEGGAKGSDEKNEDGRRFDGKKEDLAVILKNVESVLLQGAVAARSVADDLMVCRDDADEMVDERCRELDESSSRCEHSEGEDSMFGYGSNDDDHDNGYRFRVRNVEDGHRDDGGVGNLMVMNSSVAFGANDWEEFELDGMENVKESNEDLWVRSRVGCEDASNSPYLNLMESSPVERFQWREEGMSKRNVAMDNEDHLEVDKSLECSVNSIIKATETKAIESSGEVLGRQRLGCEDENNSSDLSLMGCSPVEKFQWREEELSERIVASDNNDSLSSITKSTEKEIGRSEDVLERQRLITSNDETDDYLENCSMYNVFEERSSIEHDVGENLSMMCEKERKNLDLTSDVTSNLDDVAVSLQCMNSPPCILAGEDQFPSDACEDLKLDAFGVQGARLETSPEGNLSKSASTLLESEEGRMCGDAHLHDGPNSSNQAKYFGMNDLYDDFVLDMEEILLESCGSSGITLKQKHSEFQYDQSSSLRNGESISSSGFVDGNLLNHHSLRIDKVEVVGAKQKRGDISLSERLVGVKEYTVYIIRAWSGKYQWDVERRYRDFYELYHQLKTYFAAREWILPPVWSSADKESRKFFGSTTPNVVAERSTLIQECLSTILQSKYCSNLPSALILFLSPPEDLLSSSQSSIVKRQSSVGPCHERVPSLGKTISLIVDIRSHKSVKELLDIQHYTCAGCHSHIDNGKSRMLEIVQTFGWGKPRFCEYTGQMFCSSCHTNETAVLPAKVLHNWDFSPYPVSQMAKSYLDSIVDKPMLCVSAANPFLFSRVPALLHVVGVRRKIGTMLPYIRCSFRRSIYRRLGYRKYLLESNDFFALRDLVDLSKGAFAGLPAILEAVLKKIEEHITELCLECCDNGVPCGARQACDDLSSLIFPFQEDEILRCKSCKAVFHKHCYNKLVECPCGEVLSVNAGSLEGSSSLALKKSDSKSSSRLLSSLFSFSRQEKGQKDNNNVILMGSLPNNSL